MTNDTQQTPRQNDPDALSARTDSSSQSQPVRFSPAKLIRTALGGILMGIANLIPGVSGGTMILAMGLYEEFIDSVADITALRFSVRRIFFLGVIGMFAIGAIVGLAGVILFLLFQYTSAMFALFIGLTLGGAPLLAKSLRPVRVDVLIATICGLGLMIGISLLKTGSGFPHNTIMDFVSGVVGSTTMVLPGISGSYMLLVLEQYERVVGAVHDLKQGLRPLDTGLLKSCAQILAPVAIGAVLGIVGLSHLLKYLLHRHHRVTVGVLLGILLGSVVGLWPFGRQPSEKSLEDRSADELRTAAVERWRIPGSESVPEAELAAHILANWDERKAPDYAPVPVAVAAGLVVGGFLVTFGVSRSGQRAGRHDDADGSFG